MKGPRDPAHLICTFVTAMEGDKRWVRAHITTSAGLLVEVLEARNEALLRALIEEIYPGIYYRECKAPEDGRR